MYLLSINSDLWKCLPPLVFNISVYFNCTGKLVAAFYIKTNSRLWGTIAWKCLFLLEVNFQSHFYYGGLFSGFSFHGLLSQNTEQSRKLSNALFPTLYPNVKVLMFSFTSIYLLTLAAHLLLPHAQTYSRPCSIS